MARDRLLALPTNEATEDEPFKPITGTAIDAKFGLDVVVLAEIPPSPSLTSVTAGDAQNILVWTAVPAATDYVVVFQTTSGVTRENGTAVVTGSTSTVFIHTGLVNGTEYFYRVYAVGTWGDTALSIEEKSATPTAFTNTLATIFDGVDEFIDFGTTAHSFEHDVAFSLSMWVKQTSLGSQKCLWAKATNDANVFGWGVYVSATGQAFIQVRASGQLRSYTSTVGFAAGTYVHFVMTYNGGSNINGMRVYFDAVVEATPGSGTITNTLITGSNSQIARRNASFTNDTTIDEVTFWDVALSAAEVTELYNAGVPFNPNNHSQAVNLRHWYRAGDQDTFPTWTDSVTGTVNGTMINMESGDFTADPA